jgi:hypothetical protein
MGDDGGVEEDGMAIVHAARPDKLAPHCESDARNKTPHGESCDRLARPRFGALC